MNDDPEKLILRETGLIENVNEFCCFQRGNVPAKKLRNSLERVGKNVVSADDVFFLIDTTVLGSAKKGFIFTQDTLYWSVEFTPEGHIRYDEIEKIYLTGDDYILINDHKIFINIEFQKQSEIEKLLLALAEASWTADQDAPEPAALKGKSESDLINLSKVIMDLSMRIPNINSVWYYRKHHISPKRMDGAVLLIANGAIRKDDVVLVLDTTIGGRGKKGMVFTKDRFFWCDEDHRKGSFLYSDITEIKRPSKFHVSINGTLLKFIIDELILRIMCDLLFHLRDESWRILQWYADQGIYVQGESGGNEGQNNVVAGDGGSGYAENESDEIQGKESEDNEIEVVWD